MGTTVAKTRRPLLFIVALAIVLWSGWQLTFPTPVQAERSPDTQALVVRFAPDADPAARQALLDRLGSVVEWIEPLGVARVERVGGAAGARGGLRTLAAALESRAEVLYAEPDGLVQGVPLVEEEVPPLGGTIPAVPGSPVQVNDPAFNNRQWVYAPWLVGASTAWSYTMGSPEVVIAVVDSGIDAEHPDLRGRIAAGGYDFVDNDADPTDEHGHGTHVAGIIAATANNGIGSAGICPGCSLLPVRVLNEYNVGSWFDVAAGVVYAVDQGAQVINLSLGGSAMPQVMADAIAYAAERQVLVVAAAGNSRSDTPFYPAADPRVIAVGATRDDDTLWSLSNFGPWVELTAPGYAIYSTYNRRDNVYSGYTFMSGTSMAAPHVAGLAGLLLSQDPGRTPGEIRELMRRTAVDLGEVARDNRFGYGRIDVAAGLALGYAESVAGGTPGRLSGQVSMVGGREGQRSGVLEAVVRVRTLAGQEVARVQPAPENGRWEVTSLAPGTYRVMADVPGTRVAVEPAYYEIQVEAGQTVQGLDFALQAEGSTAPVFVAYLPQVHR